MASEFTIFMAHPDDEVIFGWPVLGDTRHIVCCSSDEDNPTREWCKYRVEGLKRVGELVGAEVWCAPYDSEFYRMTTRDEALKKAGDFMLEVLAETEGPVFTHNPWGEYGHLDHILVHQLVRTSGRQLWCSDIWIESNWLPFRERPVWPGGAQEWKPHFDEELYRECEKIYRELGCWTWSKEPVREARVYAL